MSLKSEFQNLHFSLYPSFRKDIFLYLHLAMLSVLSEYTIGPPFLSLYSWSSFLLCCMLTGEFSLVHFRLIAAFVKDWFFPQLPQMLTLATVFPARRLVSSGGLCRQILELWPFWRKRSTEECRPVLWICFLSIGGLLLGHFWLLGLGG